MHRRPSCYAQRQLHPFNGVLQVIANDRARAFSVNGLFWQVQVIAERPGHTWRSDTARQLQQFFNWGIWSAEDGMRQVTANPILDIGGMSRAADELLQQLQSGLHRLPFALADRFEYWCCDHQGNPVALLGSACEREDVLPLSGKWQALPREQAGEKPLQPRLVETLEQRVRQRAQTRHWFERQPGGTGIRLDGHQQLAAGAFPELGLTEAWPGPDLPLVRTYLDHLAPLLLMLPMSNERREALERAALARPALVDELYRVYPAIAQPHLIEQARVKARLQQSV